jgi:ABC-type lipoprotein release transport system permease subunit
MLIVRIAFRNLLRHRRRSVFTALLMAVAFTLFSVSLGVTEGSYSRMIEMYTRTHTGHLQIHKKGYLDNPTIHKGFNDYMKIGSIIESIDGVESWSPRVYVPALAFSGQKTAGIRISGIEPEMETRTTVIKEKLIDGRFLSNVPAKEIILTSKLVRILHAGVGDQLALIGQGADGSIANDLYRITGILESSDWSTCYMHIEDARQFASLSDVVHEIAVTLEDESDSGRTAVEIRKSLDNEHLDVQPWYEVEKDFYRAMQMDKEGNWITQLIIMLIVAIGVLNTVLMSILERTREFGILRAIGTRPLQIFAMIISETLFLSVSGVVIGIAMSVVANYLLSVYGITLPTPIELEGLHFESYVSEMTAPVFIIPALVTFAVAVVVSIFPAIRAAAVTPARALRTD